MQLTVVSLILANFGSPQERAATFASTFLRQVGALVMHSSCAHIPDLLGDSTG